MAGASLPRPTLAWDVRELSSLKYQILGRRLRI